MHNVSGYLIISHRRPLSQKLCEHKGLGFVREVVIVKVVVGTSQVNRIGTRDDLHVRKELDILLLGNSLYTHGRTKQVST